MKKKIEARYNYWKLSEYFSGKFKWMLEHHDEDSLREWHPFWFGVRGDGPRIDAPTNPPRIIPTKPPTDPAYDFAVYPPNWVASPRLQAFLAEHAPGQVEFLPLQPLGPYAHHLDGYGLAYCREPWDILHKLPLRDYGSPFPSIRSFDLGCINHDKLTPSMIIGPTKYEYQWLIRNDLKLKLKKHGLTGFCIDQRPFMPGILQPFLHKRQQDAFDAEEAMKKKVIEGM